MSVYPLLIIPYKFTGDEIAKIKNDCFNLPHHFKRFLPELVVRKDNNKVDQSEYYLSNITEGKEEYLLFTIYATDPWLKEEMENNFEEFFNNLDFTELFKRLTSYKYDSVFNSIPRVSVVLIDMTYIGTGDDYKVDVSIYGILKDNGDVLKTSNECIEPELNLSQLAGIIKRK